MERTSGEWLPEVSGCDWNDFINGYAGVYNIPITKLLIGLEKC